MKRTLVACGLLLLAACGDDDGQAFRFGRGLDAGTQDASADASKSQQHATGVCELDKCPAPDMGVACCSPLAQCGFDPTGLGLSCVPNPGEASGRVCELSECPIPSVGTACCTPQAQCGFDPFGTGLFCFAFPAPVNVDAGAPACDLSSCPQKDGGPAACCQDNGECGEDTLGIGLCLPPATETDAGQQVMSGPPDDPSLTGECPSFIDFLGNPVWGCCSQYSVCGTFAFGECLLPVGTEIPVGPAPDDDAGVTESFLRCTPPAK